MSVRRVAIVGGGISGLAAAWRLQQLAPRAQVTLFDSRSRLGGVIETAQRDDFLLERSADMFTTKDPWALDLCEQLDYSGELINTNSQFRRAFVIFRGRLVEVPAGFTLMSPARVWPVLKTPLLSLGGKVRMASEYFRGRKKTNSDESLQSFAVRRFGKQAFERLIQPLIGGIYTADPKKLSMNATMSQFVEMEQQYGSLIKGMRAKKKDETSGTSGARYGMFVTPRLGLSHLIETLTGRLDEVTWRTNTIVTRLSRSEAGWHLHIGEDQPETPFDAVVLATPAHATAELLRDVDTTLADDLAKIDYASAALVAVSFRRDQIAHPLDGFGFVAPRIERRQILAGSFSSVKFDGRAPDDRVLIRVFVGGALQGELVELPDAALEELVVAELRQLLTIEGDPLWIDITRWRRTMPQYHVGHLDLVSRIEQRLAGHSGLALAGNAYRGVGIPFCVRSGNLAAESLVESLPTGRSEEA